MDWIIRQNWEDVLMVHHLINPALLIDHVPFELDLFNGQAAISIVPFRMTNIRFPFTPSIPLLSSLWELNLRTYVRVGNQSGVYFVTLDSDSRLGVWLAQNFFALPYRKVPLMAQTSSGHYSMRSNHPSHSFEFETNFEATVASAHDLEFNHWATERYQLFTRKRQDVLCGRVKHHPWNLKPITITKFKEDLTKMLGVHFDLKPKLGFYQDIIKVQFSAFEVVSN